MEVLYGQIVIVLNNCSSTTSLYALHDLNMWRAPANPSVPIYVLKLMAHVKYFEIIFRSSALIASNLL